MEAHAARATQRAARRRPQSTPGEEIFALSEDHQLLLQVGTVT